MSKSAPTNRQIPLGLSVTSQQGSDMILVGVPNEAAFAWLKSWPNWPGRAPGLNIFGPSGAGKSLLARHFSDANAALYFSEYTSFSPEELQKQHIVLDGVDISSSWQEEALFHLYNWVASQQGSLLILSRVPIAQLEWSLPDLASRFATSASQEIYLPDDDFLSDYLVHLFSNRQCNLTESVLSYLLQRIPRNYEFANMLVDSLDKTSMSLQKPISVMMAKSVLSELGIEPL